MPRGARSSSHKARQKTAANARRYAIQRHEAHHLPHLPEQNCLTNVNQFAGSTNCSFSHTSISSNFLANDMLPNSHIYPHHPSTTTYGHNPLQLFAQQTHNDNMLNKNPPLVQPHTTWAYMGRNVNFNNTTAQSYTPLQMHYNDTRHQIISETNHAYQHINSQQSCYSDQLHHSRQQKYTNSVNNTAMNFLNQNNGPHPYNSDTTTHSNLISQSTSNKLMQRPHYAQRFIPYSVPVHALPSSHGKALNRSSSSYVDNSLHDNINFNTTVPVEAMISQNNALCNKLDCNTANACNKLSSTIKTNGSKIDINSKQKTSAWPQTPT